MTRRRLSAVAAPASAPAAADAQAAQAARAARSTPAATQAAAWLPLLEALPDPGWLVHLDSATVVQANSGAAALFGCAPRQLSGRCATSLLDSPEDAAWWAAAAAGEVHALQSETVVGTPDGRLRHVRRSIRPLPVEAAGGQPALALVTLVDRSAEQAADVGRDAALAELQATLDSTSDGILVLDLQGRIRHFNRRFAELWDLPPALLTQRDDAAVTAWMHGQVVPTAPMASPAPGPANGVAPARSATLERLHLASGRVLERASRPLMQGGRLQGRVHAFRDLTERLAIAHRVQELGRTDTLTGLPNRAALVERVAVEAALVRSPAAGGRGFALLLVDLDRFRDVNQNLGQDVGDQVLCEVARRLKRLLRAPDLVARLGSDQFVALVRLSDTAPADEAAAPGALGSPLPVAPGLLAGALGSAAIESVAGRVLEAVSRPLRLGAEGAAAGYSLTCSIGVVLCPAHGGTPDELLRRAEAALRSVKHSGRSHWRLHLGHADADRRRQTQLDQAMRQALVSNRFRLHYQPQVSLADGRIVGAEALLRWRDPALGEIAPAQFIPVAEDTGFIVAIGTWVLAEAVRQATLWAQRGHALPVAVNVSALQFQQRDFVEHVDSVLRVSGLAPSLLELELTESVLVHEPEEALLRLQALAALGVRLSLDDFGTGYSVIGLLQDRRLPVRTLKIDRSFVSGLPDDPRSAGIVRGMLEMAHACGLGVVAEGVETPAQAAFLRSAGCGQYQGWLCAPAMDSLSFEQRLRAGPAPFGAAVGATGEGGGQGESLPPARPGLRLVG